MGDFGSFWVVLGGFGWFRVLVTTNGISTSLTTSFSPDLDFQSICSLTRHFDTRCREMAPDPGDKDFILSDIAHGFHLVNDLSSISSADCTNYLSAT